jgi:hypothetical protein
MVEAVLVVSESAMLRLALEENGSRILGRTSPDVFTGDGDIVDEREVRSAAFDEETIAERRLCW